MRYAIVCLMLFGFVGCSDRSASSPSESTLPEVVSEEHVDWSKKRPADLLEELKRRPNSIYTIWFVPENWITKEDVSCLMTLLDSEEPCASTVSAISSDLGRWGSTVGHEACFLIQGFREGRYPPELNSSRFTPNRAEIRQWWEEFQKEH